MINYTVEDYVQILTFAGHQSKPRILAHTICWSPNIQSRISLFLLLAPFFPPNLFLLMFFFNFPFEFVFGPFGSYI